MRVHVSFGVNCTEKSRKTSQGPVPNGLMQIPGFARHVWDVPTFKRSHAGLGRRFPRSGKIVVELQAPLCQLATQSRSLSEDGAKTKVVCQSLGKS